MTDTRVLRKLKNGCSIASMTWDIKMKEKERLRQVILDIFNFYAFHSEPDEEERHLLRKDRDFFLNLVYTEEIKKGKRMEKITVEEICESIMFRMSQLEGLVKSGIAGDFSKGEYSALEDLLSGIKDRRKNER